MELALIIEVLKEGLKLKNTKESNKYRDKVISLEKSYYEELKKPYGTRSQLMLDNIMLELETIARNFTKFDTE